MMEHGVMYAANAKKIRDFKDRVKEEGLLVIKCSGKTLGHETLGEIAELKTRNRVRNLVIVHGGGKQITDAMKRLGMEVKFHNGYRATDDKAMEIVERELVKINNEVAGYLRAIELEVAQFGYGVFCGKAMGAETGRYGRITQTHLLGVADALLEGKVAIVAPMGRDWGGGKLNLNADDAAVCMAVALGGSELILTTDVDGVKTREGNIIRRMGVAEAEKCLADGSVSEGMVPKLRAGIYAAENGAVVKIANGNREGVITMATNGNEKGTTIIPARAEGRVPAVA